MILIIKKQRISKKVRFFFVEMKKCFTFAPTLMKFN